MNAILLTLIALPGADVSAINASSAYAAPGDDYGAAGAYASPSGYGATGGAMGSGDACDACEGGRHGHHDGNCGLRSWCGPMPQSCYNPSFGCYPSTRFMHRYPAFHNVYYRKAYNYRNYFDYPWHAGLHEPTSMFSYHVPGEAAPQVTPVPVPAAAAAPRNMQYR